MIYDADIDGPAAADAADASGADANDADSEGIDAWLSG